MGVFLSLGRGGGESRHNLFMPLVGKVGRKRARARLAMGVLYAVLSLGAVTTLFPFLVMVSTGFKGPTDQNDNRLVPAYWSDGGELLVKYRDDKYAGNASLMSAMALGPEQGADPVSETEIEAYRAFLEGLPATHWEAGFKTPSNHVTSRLNVAWQGWLKQKYGSLDAVNLAFNEINGAFQQVTPPPEKLGDPTWVPKGDQKWADWLAFKEGLPEEYRIPITERRLWQEFLRTKFQNQIEAVPEAVRLGATSFEEIGGFPLMTDVRTAEVYRPLEAEFREKGVPPLMRGVASVEERWRESGQTRSLPVMAEEADFVASREGEVKGEFTWRNYRYILDYVAINGKALVNTAIFCLLAIATQLTVNPLAAYALSRYPMKWTGQILLFLLATMAFPAEVTMIPAFLLLKDLGLLNTFGALVLPAAASGFMIFLLKGFFDSLPREVFDSGQIDGAPEWVMMTKIAFPLSKPVFGYMALLAFMGAYGAFLYAFLVAQDREIWTLMVFIYQLQQVAPKPVIMAATTIAAVPTLLVFLAAQGVIMRGIVLPGER